MNQQAEGVRQVFKLGFKGGALRLVPRLPVLSLAVLTAIGAELAACTLFQGLRGLKAT